MSPAMRILIGLGLGLSAGVAMASLGVTASHPIAATAEIVGGLWLDALRMTILPQVFSLVVTGVSATVGVASGGAATRISLALFIIFLLGSAALAALLVPMLLAISPRRRLRPRLFGELWALSSNWARSPGSATCSAGSFQPT